MDYELWVMIFLKSSIFWDSDWVWFKERIDESPVFTLATGSPQSHQT